MATVMATVTKPAAGTLARPTVVSCQADDARAALMELEAEADVKLLRAGGTLRPGVVVFVNSEDVRAKGGLARPLQDGDVVRVVMPMTDT
jgi:molybdopterin converting factor small subunit